MVFDIRKYGAIPDGKTLNTKAIQACIDDCFNNGGGRVEVSGGTFMTGTISLKSNIELYIDAGAVLLGSPNCDDYPIRDDVKHVKLNMLPRDSNASMIFCEESENVSISGMGTIDCNGKSFTYESVGGAWYFSRIDAPTPPRVVFITGCKNVKVQDVTLTNAPAGWAYWIHDCDYVVFDRAKVLIDIRYPNNDGIHINSCRNVVISNCDLECGDDCIIVRANNASLHENKVCEKISVSNCNLTSWSAGIRIAWTNDGTIRNCTFDNINMTDTSVGISIRIPPKGVGPRGTRGDFGFENTLIENLVFSNITMNDAYSTPVFIKIWDDESITVDKIQNIQFNNIVSRGYELPYIEGTNKHYIKNITFNDCYFEKHRLEEPKRHGGVNFGEYHEGIGWMTNNEFRSVTIRNAENIKMNNTEFVVKD